MSKNENIITLPWNEDTFLEGAKTAYDYDMQHSWRKYAGWFFIALTQFGVVSAIKGGAIGLLLISTLVVIYWYGLRWPMRRRILKRFFQKERYANQTINIKFDKDGLCIEDSCINWSNFKRALISSKGYLLDMGDSFLYLPKRVFIEENSKNFTSTLKNNIKTLIRVDN